MNVIPSSNYVNISSFNDDFNSNETYKKWSEISPSAPAIPITTRYTVGGFEPNKQIAINVNGSFWNAILLIHQDISRLFMKMDIIY